MRCFNYIRQEVAVRNVSDHCLIILMTNPPPWGPSPFCFENMWLDDHRFKESFTGWWREETIQGWAGYKFMIKLKNIRSHLKIWNKEVFGDLRIENQGYPREFWRLIKRKGVRSGPPI